MDKRKKLSLGNNLALCFIAIISIVIAIGASSLFYYFDKYVDVSTMSSYYKAVKSTINVIFTLTVIALMVHIQYKILGKTLLSRIDMKKNTVLKQVAYWVISVIMGIIVLYLFDTFVEKFDKYFLFMLLAIVEVCDIVADYMLEEFDVNNEEISLAYLIFAVMIAACCYVVFNFSNILIENKILERHNSEKQLCIVAKNLLSKIESNNIVELKEYVNRINSIKDNNELIEQCTNYINSFPDVINDEQLEQLREILDKMSYGTYEYQLNESYLQEKEDLRKALTIEGLLIFFMSLITFVISVQIKKTLKENETKKSIRKQVKKAEVKPETKKVEEKAEVKPETKKVEKKAEAKKVEVKAKAKKAEVKKTETKKATAKKENTKKKK